MSTVQIAKEVRELVNKEDWKSADECRPDADSDTEVRGVFVGTVFALDPCGRYHHMLSPNGVTRRCEQFWESLDRQLDKRGLSLECGPDPCDYFAYEYRTGGKE